MAPHNILFVTKSKRFDGKGMVYSIYSDIYKKYHWLEFESTLTVVSIKPPTRLPLTILFSYDTYRNAVYAHPRLKDMIEIFKSGLC